MRCLAHKLTDFSKNVFVDVFATWMIKKQLFNLLEFKVLMDLNMPKNVFMLNWIYGICKFFFCSLQDVW